MYKINLVLFFRLDIWNNDFGSSRINLDDCLTPAQYQWIFIAVLTPLGAVAFILISAYFVNNWLKKSKQNYKEKVAERERLNKLRNQDKNRNPFGGRGRRTNRSSQFEIVEE